MMLRIVQIKMVLLIGFSFLIFSSFTGFTEENTITELTLKQKEAEFKYLTQLIRDVYPFTTINSKIKGLNNIVDLENEYIHRAINTKFNDEYFEVVRSYVMQLQCGYHAYICWPIEVEYYNDPYVKYYFINGKPDLNKVNYWWEKEQKYVLEQYVTSDLKTIYKNGGYYLTNDYVDYYDSGKIIPVHSTIEKINDLPPDIFARSLQTKIPLYYDPDYKKLYFPDPFFINPGLNKDGWEVQIKTPDNCLINAFIPQKINRLGFSRLYKSYPTVVCQELNNETGYIRIGNFGFKDEEFLPIHDFLKKSGGKFKKLIIDIRGNHGGTQRIWMDYVIAPLIKHTLTYDVTVALRKKLVEKFDLRKSPSLTPYYHFKRIRKVDNYPGFNNDDWCFFQVTREIKPKNRVPFNGLIYLLVDHNTYSAAEYFAVATKNSGFAKVVGTRSGGGGGSIFTPLYCQLPESGILFRFEVAFLFNQDGTYNITHCTEPDVWLEPVPFPANFGKDTLLNDPWIQGVMED